MEKEDSHESSLSARSKRTVITQETIKKKKRMKKHGDKYRIKLE